MMRINKKQLRWPFLCMWLLIAAFIVLNENHIVETGYLVGHEGTIYKLHSLCVVLTMAIVYLTLRMFSFRKVRKQMETSTEREQKRLVYRLGVVRIVLTTAATLLNLAVYYATLELTGGLCALMIVLSSVLCWPEADDYPSNENKA